MFIQSWHPALKGKYDLPCYSQRMIMTTKKYNVDLDVLAIPESAKRHLHAWYHIGSNKYQEDSAKERQLNAYNINDLLNLIKCLERFD